MILIYFGLTLRVGLGLTFVYPLLWTDSVPSHVLVYGFSFWFARLRTYHVKKFFLVKLKLETLVQGRLKGITWAKVMCRICLVEFFVFLVCKWRVKLQLFCRIVSFCIDSHLWLNSSSCFSFITFGLHLDLRIFLSDLSEWFAFLAPNLCIRSLNDIWFYLVGWALNLGNIGAGGPYFRFGDRIQNNLASFFCG